MALAAVSSEAISIVSLGLERSSLPSLPGAGSASTNSRSAVRVFASKRTRISTVSRAGSVM